jgi:uncharacterized phage-associated protein
MLKIIRLATMPDRKTSSHLKPRKRDSALREQLDALREEVEAALRQGESTRTELKSTLAKHHDSLLERLESALARPADDAQLSTLRTRREALPREFREEPEPLKALAERVGEISRVRALARELEAFHAEPEPFQADWPIPRRSSTHTRFNFNESKTVEALVFIATRWPGITPFFVAKVLFFADRDHLRAYGRPVTGDVYIAMADGPVPTHVYDMVKGNLDFFGDPEAVTSALRVDRNQRYPRLYAERDPKLDLLSETDITALKRSVVFCQERSFRDLSNLTHQEVAWIEAAANGEMNPELLVPDDMREEVREAAAYAVL